MRTYDHRDSLDFPFCVCAHLNCSKVRVQFLGARAGSCVPLLGSGCVLVLVMYEQENLGLLFHSCFPVVLSYCDFPDVFRTSFLSQMISSSPISMASTPIQVLNVARVSAQSIEPNSEGAEDLPSITLPSFGLPPQHRLKSAPAPAQAPPRNYNGAGVVYYGSDFGQYEQNSGYSKLWPDMKKHGPVNDEISGSSEQRGMSQRPCTDENRHQQAAPQRGSSYMISAAHTHAPLPNDRHNRLGDTRGSEPTNLKAENPQQIHTQGHAQAQPAIPPRSSRRPLTSYDKGTAHAPAAPSTAVSYRGEYGNSAYQHRSLYYWGGPAGYSMQQSIDFAPSRCVIGAVFVCAGRPIRSSTDYAPGVLCCLSLNCISAISRNVELLFAHDYGDTCQCRAPPERSSMYVASPTRACVSL